MRALSKSVNCFLGHPVSAYFSDILLVQEHDIHTLGQFQIHSSWTMSDVMDQSVHSLTVSINLMTIVEGMMELVLNVSV